MTDLERALNVAEVAHANQKYDIYSYMYHIKQVVKIATELGYDSTILVSCALHDVMEDADLSYNDIKKAFGEDVAEIVFAVTDELGRNRKERKEKTYPKIRANWKAVVVKICDRIANATHSQQEGGKSGMFKLYKKEHEDFCRNLDATLQHEETKRAWERLEKLLGNSSNN